MNKDLIKVIIAEINVMIKVMIKAIIEEIKVLIKGMIMVIVGEIKPRWRDFNLPSFPFETKSSKQTQPNHTKSRHSIP